MRAWEVQDAWGVERLKQVEAPEPPPPGPGQVAVRIHAASLNFRDLKTIEGMAPAPENLRLVPFSDGAGEVVAVGDGVTRVKIGDRVCPTFFQGWVDGPPTGKKRANALGSLQEPGVLQDIRLLSQEGVSRFPEHMTYIEAATLPCAALTAWRALMVEGGLKAGQNVLVEGTGGVSIFGLQISKMAGASVTVTSSSDEKLKRAEALGADHLVNYREIPEWGRKVRELTGGSGVDQIIEVGGAGTIDQAISAAGVYCNILIVGALAGNAQMTLQAALGKNLKLHGISVGSRIHFEDMCRAMGEHRLKPVVDRVYGFEEVPAALRAMQGGEHFGKICIDFAK